MIVAHGLYELIPPGEARDQVAERVIAYLKGNPVERESPAEWLFEAGTFTEFELTDKAKLLAWFRASGDAGPRVVRGAELRGALRVRRSVKRQTPVRRRR